MSLVSGIRKFLKLIHISTDSNETCKDKVKYIEECVEVLNTLICNTATPFLLMEKGH